MDKAKLNSYALLKRDEWCFTSHRTSLKEDGANATKTGYCDRMEREKKVRARNKLREATLLASPG